MIKSIIIGVTITAIAMALVITALLVGIQKMVKVYRNRNVDNKTK